MDYDSETKSSYGFMVIVEEPGTNDRFLAGIYVTVNITDVDESTLRGGKTGHANVKPANRASSFGANVVATLSVAENSPAGTNVGAPVTATDPDNDSITYSLSGVDAASCAIDGATGQIATVADVTCDYETKSSYSVSVDDTVPISLSAGALHVSKDTPQNEWRNTPGAGYEHRKNVRRNNGKMVLGGSNTVTMTLETGETYTAEAADAFGSFAISIAP